MAPAARETQSQCHEANVGYGAWPGLCAEGESCEPGQEPFRAMEDKTLSMILSQLTPSIVPTISADWEFVSSLQKAPSNQGQVDVMRRLGISEGSFAVKTLPSRWMTSSPCEFEATFGTAQEQPWRDVQILIYLNSLNFAYACDFHGLFCCADSMLMASSLANLGDLFAVSAALPPPDLSRSAVVWSVAMQLLDALRQLHNLGIAHMDVSAENVVLHNSNLKLIDFGGAVLAQTWRGVKGKWRYAAPESFLSKDYDTFLSDAWAAGFTLFGFACENFPWTMANSKSAKFKRCCTCGFKRLIRKVPAGRSEKMAASVMAPGLINLLEGLLTIDPSKRLTLGEACFERSSAWDCAWIASEPPQDSLTQ